MIALLNALYDYLAADTTLTGLLGHTESDKRIVRAQQAAKPKVPSLVMQALTHVKLVDGLPQPRTVTVSLIAYAEHDEDADAIAERVIPLLHGQNVSNEGMHVYDSAWDDFREGPFWSDAEQAFRLDTRFRFIVRSDGEAAAGGGYGGGGYSN